MQVALQQCGLYHGTIDGVDGKATRRAVLALQRRKGLVAQPGTKAAGASSS